MLVCISVFLIVKAIIDTFNEEKALSPNIVTIDEHVVITGNEWPQPGTVTGLLSGEILPSVGWGWGAECCVKMFWRFITFDVWPGESETNILLQFLIKSNVPSLSPYARVIEIDASKKVKQNFVASLTFQFNFYRVWTGTFQIICLLLLCNTGLGDDSTNTDTKEETLVRVLSVVTQNMAPGRSTRAWNEGPHEGL